MRAMLLSAMVLLAVASSGFAGGFPVTEYLPPDPAPIAEPAKLPDTAQVAFDDQLYVSAQHAEKEKAAEQKQAAALKRTDIFTTQKRGVFGRRTHEHTTVIEVDQDGQPTELMSDGDCANGNCGNSMRREHSTMIQMETGAGYSGSGCGAGGCGNSGMSRREMRRMSRRSGGGCSGGGCN